jgi:hypothetical protein
MINWNSVLVDNGDLFLFGLFAGGHLSGRQLYAHYVNGDQGGIVRGLLRKYGVSRLRGLAKKAVERRSVSYA